MPAQVGNPERILMVARSQWGIENGLHYRRDVTPEEDKTRMTSKSMGRIMTIINRLAISFLNDYCYQNHATLAAYLTHLSIRL